MYLECVAGTKWTLLIYLQLEGTWFSYTHFGLDFINWSALHGIPFVFIEYSQDYWWKKKSIFVLSRTVKESFCQSSPKLSQIHLFNAIHLILYASDQRIPAKFHKDLSNICVFLLTVKPNLLSVGLKSHYIFLLPGFDRWIQYNLEGWIMKLWWSPKSMVFVMCDWPILLSSKHCS